jgi:hypothetical protein
MKTVGKASQTGEFLATVNSIEVRLQRRSTAHDSSKKGKTRCNTPGKPQKPKCNKQPKGGRKRVKSTKNIPDKKEE